jgi:hypothetical protein
MAAADVFVHELLVPGVPKLNDYVGNVAGETGVLYHAGNEVLSLLGSVCLAEAHDWKAVERVYDIVDGGNRRGSDRLAGKRNDGRKYSDQDVGSLPAFETRPVIYL